jgi:hypothetical protein
LSNEWQGARERLSLLEALIDPWTIRNLGKIGVREGWNCLEVAGGGGSIAEWLCRQVGGSGHVVATDLEPRFLEAITNLSNLEVWRHDILREPLPEGRLILYMRAPCCHFSLSQRRRSAKWPQRLSPEAGSC